jgi:hypothetical protein
MREGRHIGDEVECGVQGKWIGGGLGRAHLS